jgi:hypothetical protein
VGDGPPGWNALARLTDALYRTGRVPLTWAVEWCPDGDLDAAVRRAWEACHVPVSMLDALWLAAGRPMDGTICPRFLAAMTAKRSAREPYEDADRLDEYEADWRRIESDAIRTAVPVPPTLAQLLAPPTKGTPP